MCGVVLLLLPINVMVLYDGSTFCNIAIWGLSMLNLQDVCLDVAYSSTVGGSKVHGVMDFRQSSHDIHREGV